MIDDLCIQAVQSIMLVDVWLRSEDTGEDGATWN